MRKSTLYNSAGNDVIMQCSHCDNRTAFTSILDYEETYYKEDTRIPLSERRWYVMVCQNCSNPIFMQSVQAFDHGQKFSGPTTKLLYPSDKVPLTDLPKEVEEKYREALKVSTISPSSCAVQVRKTLEAICKHENAPGRVLADKLKHLAATGRIPQTLVDVALHLRQLGNLGAHFDEDEVTKEDVSIILDFVELLLEYLYVAPAKIETVRKRLDKAENL